MKIIGFLLKKSRNIVILFLIVVSVLVTIDNYTNNKVVLQIAKIQEKMTQFNNHCQKTFKINDNVLYLENFSFDIGDGNCINQLKENNVKNVVINNVYGGDTTETRIVAKYLKENNIPVIIKGQCLSSCVDFILHSPDRTFCLDGGVIGIHAYEDTRYNENIISKSFRVRMQDAMLLEHENSSINTDFIKDTYHKTPNTDIYLLNPIEIKNNRFAHRFIYCN